MSRLVQSNGYPLKFHALAESAILIRVGKPDVMDQAVVDTVIALANAIERAELAGIGDLIPAYNTILVEFDPTMTDGEALEAEIGHIASPGVRAAPPASRVVIIPVVYGGEHGPDLDEMAATIGLATDELVRRHSGSDYRVACMGFSPGWAYLIGLPPELAVPRRVEPRVRIPAGSVAVGGAQTGVYPLESPGGWHLIGRTPLDMFNLDRSEPFLLKPGDYVRFAPIDDGRYRAMKQGGDGSHG